MESKFSEVNKMANNNLFHRFCALSFSKDAIGLERIGRDATYFCYPSSNLYDYFWSFMEKSSS